MRALVHCNRRTEHDAVQEGSFRCDVNVSVRPAGSATLGTKVEVKNMNSFGAMQKAIEFEVARQSALLQEGRAGDIVQETRLFDEDSQVRHAGRPPRHFHPPCGNICRTC